MDVWSLILRWFLIAVWLCRWCLLSFLIYLEPISSWHSGSLEAQSTRHWKSLLGDRVIRSFITDTVSYLLVFVVRSLPRRLENVFHPRWHGFYWLSLKENEVQRSEWKGSFFYIDGERRWEFSLMKKAGWQLHLINLPQGTYHVPGSTQNSEEVRPDPW